ncbi:MAG: 50S ribosomal protein L6 [Myxococcales bacterium]|nr:50S ribosomal protein L6 [Myxococcales bacterium]
MGEVLLKHSRVGKRALPIPAAVKVQITGSTVTVKGPRGESSLDLRPEVTLEQKDGELRVLPVPGEPKGGQFQGLTRALLGNMVEGVEKGFKRSLDFRGVGYRAELNGQQLKMTVGLSHTVTLEIPKQVSAKVETIDQAGMKYPRLHLESHEKQILGQIASRIRSVRPPEPYKGKGVRYTGEQVREKAGKTGKK